MNRVPELVTLPSSPSAQAVSPQEEVSGPTCRGRIFRHPSQYLSSSRSVISIVGAGTAYLLLGPPYGPAIAITGLVFGLCDGYQFWTVYKLAPRKTIEQMQDEISKLNLQIGLEKQRYQNQLVELQAIHEKYQKNLKILAMAISKSEQGIEGYAADIYRSGEGLAVALKQVEEFKKQNEQLKQSLQELESRLSSLNASITSAKTERMDFNTHLEKVVVVNSKMEEEVDAFHAGNFKMDQEDAEFQELIKNIQEEMGRMEAFYKSFTEDEKRLIGEVDKLRIENGQLAQHLLNIQATTKERERTIADLKEQVTQLSELSKKAKRASLVIEGLNT